MIFFPSCNTTKVVEKNIYYVPEINFPEFPKLPDYEIKEDGVLIKDESYFSKLLIFRTLYVSEMTKYMATKKLYEGENKNEKR